MYNNDIHSRNAYFVTVTQPSLSGGSKKEKDQT